MVGKIQYDKQTKEQRDHYYAYLKTWRNANPEKIKKYREQSINTRVNLLRSARNRSKRKNVECIISIEDVIITDLCPVYGVPMIRNTQYAPTLDRIDNTKGYTKGNVCVISRKANILKSFSTIDDLEKIIAYIKENTP